MRDPPVTVIVEDEPLIDLTQALTLNSKRTERLRRKHQKKMPPKLTDARQFQDLPYEIIMEILCILRPRDLFALCGVNRGFRDLILGEEARICDNIIAYRYPILARCLQRPVLMESMDQVVRQALQSPLRPETQTMYSKPFQHVQPPDNTLVCTCMTCVLRWNSLCLALDFANWQDHLDAGKPLPIIPRGTQPQWNKDLLARNATMVVESLKSPLRYIRILEMHLLAIIRSVRRHGQNKGNQRRRFQMTEEEGRMEIDAFLSRNGPPTVDFPFQRDNYYMLEAYLPNRSWIAERDEWVYLPANQHDKDVEIAMKWEAWYQKRRAEQKALEVAQEELDQKALEVAQKELDDTEAMDDLHHHFGNRQVWQKYDIAKCPTINVTEIWSHDESPVSCVESRPISSLAVDNWLDEPANKYIKADPYTRTVRLVWVGEDPATCRHSPSVRELQQLLGAWNLQSGYDYALSCYAGVAALPPQHDARIFTATYHPKLAMAWSHAVIDGVSETNLVVFAEREERKELLLALQSQWSSSFISHPMFPAFLCSLTLSQELDTTLEDIKSVVRNVEARTGHHRFSTRRQIRPAAGELGSLSAEMSGCAAKLANGTRKLKVVEALNAFMLQHAEHDPPSSTPTRTTTHAKPHPAQPPPSTILTSHLHLISQRVSMQFIDSAYVQQRVQVQIAALFHLIAQQDNAIAFETASATRSIAKDSLQDSSSMKMLALVAMFFLPGSFVAALFSAPLFEWDKAGEGMAVGTKPQFRLFWAVAVPLTVVTFGLYAMWIVMQRKRLRRRLNVGGV
ncbi:hypothetical protein B0T16DRAFT_332559 [Cercophora newfieldiana]|uniref:F-box domain-containing protein n=1 Tax=Cercophora newfieldiana TaxID=92897 RepID=A0AA40CLK4_9PEZI|nr:hypothetical protein B0T16DRAFT_332559 [Cercophora newfieldiana]